MPKEYNGLTKGEPKAGSNYDPGSAPTVMNVKDARHEGKKVGPGAGTASPRKQGGRDGL